MLQKLTRAILTRLQEWNKQYMPHEGKRISPSYYTHFNKPNSAQMLVITNSNMVLEKMKRKKKDLSRNQTNWTSTQRNGKHFIKGKKRKNQTTWKMVNLP